MTLVIDRIEEGTAVCEREDGTFIRMPAPDGAREGDLLVWTAEGWRVDAAMTRKRRETAARKSRGIKGRRR